MSSMVMKQTMHEDDNYDAKRNSIHSLSSLFTLRFFKIFKILI